jgi:hypothetical protein
MMLVLQSKRTAGADTLVPDSKTTLERTAGAVFLILDSNATIKTHRWCYGLGSECR